MKEEPHSYFSGAAGAGRNVPTLFRTQGVREVLDRPPTLREPAVGWDLFTYDPPRIVEGRKLHVSGGYRQSIDLYKDGRLVAAAILGDFLGWPRNQEQFEEAPELNSLALVEYIYNCAQTYHTVSAYIEPTPETLRLQFGFRRLWLANGKRVYLNRGIPGRIGFPHGSGHPAPSPDQDFDPVEAQASLSREDFAASTAFELLARVYNWFELEDEAVPFADVDQRRLDVDAFFAELQA